MKIAVRMENLSIILHTPTMNLLELIFILVLCIFQAHVAIFLRLLHFADGYDENCLENDMQERCSLDDGTQDNYSHDNYQCSEEYPNECQNQYQDDYSNQYVDGGGQQQQQQMNYSENKGPEILYKSSKQLYKAVAKQCGITCKMTDTCR